MKLVSMILTGLLLLPLLLATGHSPLTTTDPPLRKILIAPIYPQTWPLVTYAEVFDIQGRHTRFDVHEFTEKGGYVLGGGVHHTAGSNNAATVSFFHDFEGRALGNGWARFTYFDKDRDLRAVCRIVKYEGSKPKFTALVSGVKPAGRFRLYAQRVDGFETAISIVNPTEADQEVTVRFHAGWVPRSNTRPDPPFVEKTWTLGPMTRLSRFLTELVPIEGYYPVEDAPFGLVEVQGATQIAVGALEFDHDTGFFQGAPVFVQPPEHP